MINQSKSIVQVCFGLFLILLSSAMAVDLPSEGNAPVTFLAGTGGLLEQRKLEVQDCDIFDTDFQTCVLLGEASEDCNFPFRKNKRGDDWCRLDSETEACCGDVMDCCQIIPWVNVLGWLILIGLIVMCCFCCKCCPGYKHREKQREEKAAAGSTSSPSVRRQQHVDNTASSA